MKIEFELWHLVLMLMAFFSAVGLFSKLLLSRFDKHMDERFVQLSASVTQTEADLKEFEKAILKWQAEIPLQYVRREDYVRNQVVIEAKLDTIYSKIDQLQMRGQVNG